MRTRTINTGREMIQRRSIARTVAEKDIRETKVELFINATKHKLGG